MPVRISKPAFNLRSKLSELDVPIGAHGGQLMRSSSAEETFDLLGLSSGKRNVIGNGAMRFNQRGAASYDAANYTLDRWRYHRSTDGEFDIKQLQFYNLFRLRYNPTGLSFILDRRHN